MYLDFINRNLFSLVSTVKICFSINLHTGSRKMQPHSYWYIFGVHNFPVSVSIKILFKYLKQADCFIRGIMFDTVSSQQENPGFKSYKQLSVWYEDITWSSMFALMGPSFSHSPEIRWIWNMTSEVCCLCVNSVFSWSSLLDGPSLPQHVLGLAPETYNMIIR